VLAQLKELATVLDLDTVGTKADVIATIVKFLEKPKASGKQHPKEIKDKAKVQKEKVKAKKSQKKKKKSSAKRGGGSAAEPERARSALMLYAIENRQRVMKKSSGGDKAGLMLLLKGEFKALSASASAKWTKKAEADALRYARELKKYELELFDGLESDEDEPAPRKRKAKVKAKASAPTMDISDVSDDSDDDEPLVKRAKTGPPTKKQLQNAVNEVLTGVPIESMSKKKVRS
jgi:hypothetical protein